MVLGPSAHAGFCHQVRLRGVYAETEGKNSHSGVYSVKEVQPARLQLGDCFLLFLFKLSERPQTGMKPDKEPFNKGQLSMRYWQDECRLYRETCIVPQVVKLLHIPKTKNGRTQS